MKRLKIKKKLKKNRCVRHIFKHNTGYSVCITLGLRECFIENEFFKLFQLFTGDRNWFEISHWNCLVRRLVKLVLRETNTTNT